MFFAYLRTALARALGWSPEAWCAFFYNWFLLCGMLREHHVVEVLRQCFTAGLQDWNSGFDDVGLTFSQRLGGECSRRHSGKSKPSGSEHCEILLWMKGVLCARSGKLKCAVPARFPNPNVTSTTQPFPEQEWLSNIRWSVGYMRWRVLPSELSIITVKSSCLECKGGGLYLMRVTHRP
jgi:hypothetical protein